MLPLLDDAGLAYGAAEMKVVSANPAHLLTVEVWLAVFNGCSELTDTHIYRQNRGISTLQPYLLLNGYVQVPFSVFSVN
jgi:hypothetical protein